MRVVLGEDPALLRDGLIRLLEASGFEVVACVDNGPDSKAALLAHRPDVAVVDGDRLVGKLDAKADRAAGVLRVNAVHEDEPFGADVAAAVDGEIAALADWLQLELVRG